MFQLFFHTPVNKTSLENEILWLNSHIRIKKAPVCYKTWFEKGIIRIKDLFNQNGALHTVEYFQQKVDRNINFLDVYGLVWAIPYHWQQQTLKLTHWVDIPGEIETDKRIQNILDDAKPIYKIKQLLKSKEEKTWNNLVKKWSEELRGNLQKDTLVKRFGATLKATIATKFCDFQFCLLHRILGTNKILHKRM